MASLFTENNSLKRGSHIYEARQTINIHYSDKDAIEGVDGLLVKVEQLMSQFTMKECPTLRNKPKLFFIQAGRGHLSDSRKDRLPTSLRNTEGDSMKLYPDSTLANGVTPLEADLLLSFATSRLIFTACNAINVYFSSRISLKH